MRSKSLIAAVLLCTMMSSLHAQAGYSLDFDGSDDDVDLGTGIQFSGSDDFSVSMWVYPDNLSNYTTFLRSVGVSNGNMNLHFASNSSGTLRATVDYFGTGGGDTENYSSTSNISTGQWSLVAFTKSSTTVTIYINGSA
ncbi:MAG: LamG domain-containing protein, partial [Candidatus Marinimicrobia bacterium]|nr:LamG domain-containing protein [Candidatus Neomarinimicrobiota bacterium]